jgi:hypothetical protein
MKSRPDNEIDKFYQSADGKTVVRVGDDVALITLTESVGSITYVGSAIPGSSQSALVWQITRIDKVGQTTRVLFAGSSNLFDKAWTLRGTYVYG